jgi:alkylation response protein AidB-like acyl-CoA dehydrogenase
VAFLVSGGLEGIAVQTPRHLIAGTTHLVTFEGVRVPRSSLLGRDGEGWRNMRNALADAAEATAAAPPEDREVGDLLRYAAEATREGTALRTQPVFQQLLMEAYINSRILRLFHMRDQWMRASGRLLTYQPAETARLESRAAMRLAEIVRDVAGPHALLDRDDPRAPTGGSLELHARRSLADQNPTGAPDPSAGVMAAGVGLGERAPTARRP